jgi:hypothetical protein
MLKVFSSIFVFYHFHIIEAERWGILMGIFTMIPELG